MSAFVRSYERVVYVIRYTIQNDGVVEGTICVRPPLTSFLEKNLNAEDYDPGSRNQTLGPWTNFLSGCSASGSR